MAPDPSPSISTSRPIARSWILGPSILALVAGLAAAADEAGMEQAIARIQDAGGRIERDEFAPEKPIVFVNLGATKATDEALATLGAFPDLRKVVLNGTAVTDAGLERLKDVKGLKKLYLVDTGITDAGLAHLEGLDELEVLSLVGTKVTDEGLDHLKTLEKLRELFLYATEVTDEGAKGLTEAIPDLKIDRSSDPE